MGNVIIGGTATGATPLPVASTIDGANDLLAIYTASATATQAISRNTLLGVTGQPADISSTQTLSNKTLGNSNSITVKDGNLTLQNSSSTTKQAQFSLASITAGQTRTFTLPDVSDTVVTLTATQTLTNKTLTAPTINNGTITTPTINNPTLNVDSISGFSSANIVTIANLLINNGVLQTANSVKSTNLQSGAVTSTALASGAVTNAAIASSAVQYANLLSTIFSGQITATTNSGSAGGTLNYVNLGGIKVAWGITAAQTYAAGPAQLPNVFVNLPGGFFGSTPTLALVGLGAVGSTANQSAFTPAVTTTVLTIAGYNASNAGATVQFEWLLVGT